MELLRSVLDSLPYLSCDRGDALATNEGIDSRGQVLKLVLDEAALGEAGAEEGRVQSQQDPGAPGEDEGGAEKAEPQHNLKDGHEAHGQVVVLLHEAADGLSERGGLVGWLRGGRGAGWGHDGGWGGDGGDEVGARVGRDVEDGVDAEWEHGEGVLGGEEPDERHHWYILAYDPSEGEKAVK